MIRIRRGLDLPLPGAPEQRIDGAPAVRRVALLGADVAGLRPRFAVEPGDRVALGDLLFTDKKRPGVRYTAPGAGVVEAIHRGAKRRFESLVIRLEGDGAVDFGPAPDAAGLTRDAVRDKLVAFGLWTALRARPFGAPPPPDTAPRSLFVTALDSEPHAPDPAVALAGREGDFTAGLRLLRLLSDGPVRLCRRPGAPIPAPAGVAVHEFAGPHPAGLAGTHIHLLDPVGPDGGAVWHVGAEDVAAIGALFRTGRLDPSRVVALGGPGVERPCLLRTRLGASVDDLAAGRLRAGRLRVIAGSVLTGHAATGPVAFLGRHQRQASAIVEDVGHGARFTTASHGGPRPILPLEVFERVMALDLPAVPLLKALAVGDVERAVEYGCLELIEEDLALLSYVDPGKGDHGARLREVLDAVASEG